MSHVALKHVFKNYPDGTSAVRDVNLDIASGELLCVLGPSGCGKSSTLRMIAGLEEVSSGRIEVDGRDIVGTPARERDIAMVFENYALYPHLNVYDNIAMPLVARRTAKPELDKRVKAIAETMGITDHLTKLPSKLSGGQRQRVSLARAMVRRPKMFLMDEPLGHLEEYLRIELRREIRALHEATGGTTFYITHDQQEAAAVSDRIAVMRQGELQQVGTMPELIDRPANRFVAEFVGEPPISIFEKVTNADGRCTIGDYTFALPERLAAAGRTARPVAAGVRPASFTVGSSEAEGISAIARSVQPMGEWGAILCETPAGDATALVRTAALPEEGARIRLRPDPERVHLFDAAGENILISGGR
jgi:multiple sugar transport system ATP-binding protein